MDLAERLNELFIEKGFDILNGDCHTLTKATKAMFGDIYEDDLRDKRKVIENHVKGKVTSVQYDWIKNYCDFFGCSADYLLGFMEKDIADRAKKSGLSEKSIRKLKTNKDYLFVINSLLENNGIDYLVQALQADSFYETQSNYILNNIDTKKMLGITSDDLDIFKVNQEKGYENFQKAMACTCFDKIRKDKSLNEYFFNQASNRFSNQLNKDIKEKEGD